MKQKKMPLFLAAFTVFLLNAVLFTSCKTATTTKKYVVSYRSNILDDKTTIKDAGNPPEAIMVDEGTVLTLELLPELFYKGYTFLGWNYQSKQGVEKAEVNYTKVTKNLLLTAQWQKNAVPGDNGSDQSDSDDSDDTGTSDDDTPSPSNFVNKVCYTVNHYKQNLENNEYTVFPETLAGVVGEQTNAAAKDYAGFTLVEPVKQQKIKNDGTTVVDIYYDRNTVTINFVLDGGTTTTPLKEGSLSGKFGAPISIETPIPNDKTKTFVGWSKMLPSTFTMEADGQTYTALYGNGSQSTYTLRYWFQNIENDEYSTREGYEPETWLGFRNQLSMATAKDIYGFTAKTIAQKTVQEDNSTVVDVYYDRNIYTITFDLNGGTSATLGENNTIQGRYGSDIPVFDDIVYSYGKFYTYCNSNGEYCSKIEKNETVKAVYGYKYKVNHCVESLTQVGEYDVFKTENLIGLAYEYTKAKAVESDNVEALDIEQKLITGDNQSINIYYKRIKNVTYTFYDTDGETILNTIDKPFYSDYEEYEPDETELNGKVFSFWEPSVPEKIVENASFIIHYAPQRIEINYVRANYTTLKIKWTNPDDDALDHVKIVVKNGEVYDDIPVEKNATQQFNITGLSKGTTYEVSFYSCDESGKSGKPIVRNLTTCYTELVQNDKTEYNFGNYALNQQSDEETVNELSIDMGNDSTGLKEDSYWGFNLSQTGYDVSNKKIEVKSGHNIDYSVKIYKINEQKFNYNSQEVVMPVSINWTLSCNRSTLQETGPSTFEVNYELELCSRFWNTLGKTTTHSYTHKFYYNFGTLNQENSYWNSRPEIEWE